MQLSREIMIVNKLGMHARAAAKFVQMASACNSQIEVERVMVAASLYMLKEMMPKSPSINLSNLLKIVLVKTNSERVDEHPD